MPVLQVREDCGATKSFATIAAFFQHGRPGSLLNNKVWNACMIKICHRINTLADLKKTARTDGVEMDIHAYGDKLVVHHDAFEDAIELSAWLDAFQHKIVILNLKEEGIEYRVQALLQQFGISHYFYLDMPFPAMIRFINKTGESRVAIRVSYYEPVATALKLSGRAEWVFIDLFTEAFPLSPEEYTALKEAGYKTCLVSPELWGRSPQAIATMRDYLQTANISLDAVCTKRPELW